MPFDLATLGYLENGLDEAWANRTLTRERTRNATASNRRLKKDFKKPFPLQMLFP